MQKTALIQTIESIAPLSFAESWDKSGMQVSSFGEDISHLFVCLDPTPAVLEEALGNLPASATPFVLSHHPLSLNPSLPAQEDVYTRSLRLLFTHNAALYAAHTSLDVRGPAFWLAHELGIQKGEPLEDVPVPAGLKPDVAFAPPFATGVHGFGFVGDMPVPLSFAAFCEILSQFFPVPDRRIGHIPEQVRRVAFCGGSGSSFARAALAKGADVFLTGDVKYHDALDLLCSVENSTFALLDVGHFALEEEMMRRLSLVLTSALPGISVRFIKGINPFQRIIP